MDGLIIGLDLCDTYTQVCCYGDEQAVTIPTVICRKKNEEEWSVGEDAYGLTLIGEGIIVDKLLSLVKKDGTATIGGIRYEGLDLLKQYMKKVLELPLKNHETASVAQLTVALRKVDAKLIDALLKCADFLEIPRERLHVISHTEGFIYYILSQKREVWSNQVGMFDLSEEYLRYYELKVQRGLRQTTVIAEYEDLDEAFSLDILSSSAGGKLADKILCACGDRLLQKKLFSSIFLTGKGFETQGWAVEFMKMVCSKRRVYGESSVFAKGAAYKAADYQQEKTSYPYVFICEGRLEATVTVNIFHRDKEGQLVVASAGDNWYECKSTMDFITDSQNAIEFMITPQDPKKKKLVRIPLEGFPERPGRTTRVSVSIGFLDRNTMAVVIKDKGFGELYPASDSIIRQEVMI